MATFETHNCKYTSDAKEGDGALEISGTSSDKGYFKLVDPKLSIAKLVFWAKIRGVPDRRGYLNISHPQYGNLTLLKQYNTSWTDWQLFEVYFIYDRDTDTRVGLAYKVDPNTGKKTLVSSTEQQSGSPNPDTVSITVSGDVYNYPACAHIDSLKIYGVKGSVVSERGLSNLVKAIYEVSTQ